MEQTSQAEAIAIPPIARIGDTVAAIDTPSLILDLDIFDDNLKKMQGLAERHGVALRPHAKAHKCPEIALRQIALGAQGICCQKVSEAAPFIAAGVRDIHISNEVVGRVKLSLLARLAGHAAITVCVDHPEAVRQLSDVMVEQGSMVGVLVDVDVGQHRCGVQSPGQALDLARLIQRSPNLAFAGLQAYHGGLQHKRSLEQRKKSCDRVVRSIRLYLKTLQKAGIECATVTGGGSGTAVFDVASGVFTEIQPGSYAFMDMDYAGIDWGQTLSFGHSLFLLGTVISTPTADRAITDIGLKSTSAESGAPQPVAGTPWRCAGISDEHSVLRADDPACLPAWGSQVRLVPGHVDPTFNLHDYVVAIRGQVVQELWPVSARGLSR